MNVAFWKVGKVYCFVFAETLSDKVFTNFDTLLGIFETVVGIESRKIKVNIILIAVVNNVNATHVGVEIADKFFDNLVGEYLHIVAHITQKFVEFGKTLRSPVSLSVLVLSLLGIFFGFDKVVAHDEK